MAIWDNIFSRKKNLETDPTITGGVGFGGMVVNFGEKDRVLEVLETNGITEYDNPNPRHQMRLSRTMYDIFPFAKRAINDISTMVGNVELVPKYNSTVSEETAKEMTALLENLPILSEWNWEKPHEKGADSLVFRMVRTMLMDGMVFEEDRYMDGNLQNYQGALIFNSQNFDFVKDKIGPYRLKYKYNQFPAESPLYDITFNYTGYDYRNAYPWASPLLAGGGFFTHILTTMLIAIKNINGRKGSPIDVSIVSLKDDKMLMNRETSAAYSKTMNDLEENMQKAVQKQILGIPTSLITKTPMNVELLQKTFGADALKEVDHNVLSIVLIGFANLLEVPIEFLGLVFGSSGFSPERFTKLYNIWGTKIDNIRAKMESPMHRIIDNYLRSLKVNPAIIAGMDLRFKNAEIRDEQELATIDKTKAETHKLRTEVANELAMIDTNQARAYLEKHNVIETQ